MWLYACARAAVTPPAYRQPNARVAALLRAPLLFRRAASSADTRTVQRACDRRAARVAPPLHTVAVRRECISDWCALCSHSERPAPALARRHKGEAAAARGSSVPLWLLGCVLSVVARAATLSLHAPPPRSIRHAQPGCFVPRARSSARRALSAGGSDWPANTPHPMRCTVPSLPSPFAGQCASPVGSAWRRESSRSARDIAPLSRPHRRSFFALFDASSQRPRTLATRGHPGLLGFPRPLADVAAAARPSRLL